MYIDICFLSPDSWGMGGCGKTEWTALLYKKHVHQVLLARKVADSETFVKNYAAV